MARPMDHDAARAFLEQGTRTGKVAWVSANGAPHVAPIWFVVEDHPGSVTGWALSFNTHESSGKGKALRREGRASLVVDLEEAPYSFVKVDGTVEIAEGPIDRVRAVATAAGGRYMGAERADEYGARNGVEGEWVVTLVPTKVTTLDDVSG